MEPEEIRVKILEIVKDTLKQKGLGLYHADLRNKMGIDFEKINPILRELLDEKIIKTRKGLNGTLIFYNDKKK